MGKINVQRMVLGGLLAGVVMNAFDFVLYGVVLKDDYNAALHALGKADMSSNLIVMFVLLDFLFGIWMVWLYAAIRPRFGAGPRTAVIAGASFWVLFGLLHSLAEAPMGLFPARLYWIGTPILLVQAILATLAGGKVYSEAA